MTPFIAVCSYVSMLSLAMLLFFIFLYRLWRIRGKDYRGVGMMMILCAALFIIGVVLIGIFYRP